jgi:hypothetical protein
MRLPILRGIGILVAGMLLWAPCALPEQAPGGFVRPLELEVLVIRLMIQPASADEGPSVAISRPQFEWQFSEPPIVLTNAILPGETWEVYSAAPRAVTADGAEIVLTRGDGGLPSTGDEPAEVRINLLAVLPDEQHNVLGGRGMMADGTYIELPPSFVQTARKQELHIGPIVLVNAVGDGRPLKAAAVYEPRRSHNEYAVAEGFTLRLYDHRGQSFDGEAFVQWLAVLPGAANPFRGYVANNWRDELEMGGMRTRTRPAIVSNAHVKGVPFLTAWDGELQVQRSGIWIKFPLRYADERGAPVGRGEGYSFERDRRMLSIATPWLGVEQFYSSNLLLMKCSVEVVSNARHVNAVPYFLADVESGFGQWSDGDVSSGIRGTYFLVRAHGPPGREECVGELTFELRAVGTVDRFMTQPGITGAAVGLYSADLRAGLMHGSETDWEAGVYTSLWQVATDAKTEFFSDVGNIVVSDLPSAGVGGAVAPAGRFLQAVAGASADVATNALEGAIDAVTCDEAINETYELRFARVPLIPGETYKVFAYIKGDARAATASVIYAGGYTEIDFVGRRPNHCDGTSKTHGVNKRLEISKIAFEEKTPPPRQQVLRDQLPDDQEEPAQGADGMITLAINALNDRPGPVVLAVHGANYAGKLVLDTRVSFDADDNRYSTRTIEIPATAEIIRIMFVNDAYRPGGPDLDRNAFIDYIVWDGVRIEAEAFFDSRGRGSDPGCGSVKGEGRSGGRFAGCGNGGDYVAFRRP